MLSGCAFEVPFDVRWELPLAGVPGHAALELPVDLAEEPELWQRRDDIEEIRTENVRLRVVSVGPRNRAGELVLILRYRPAGAEPNGEAELTVAEGLVLPLAEGTIVEAPIASPLGPTVLEALRGSGRFTVVVAAEVAAPIEVTLGLELDGVALVAL
jgi:hypothetical protein